MSKYSLCLISRLLLATGFVIAEVKVLKTENITSAEERQGESTRLVSVGLLQYRKLCQATYRNADVDFMVPFLLTGSIHDESDSDTKCYIRCMLEMVGATDTSDGLYDLKQASILLKSPDNTARTDVQPVSQECNKQQAKEDLCNDAYRFMQCVINKTARQYGMPTWLESASIPPNHTETKLTYLQTINLPIIN